MADPKLDDLESDSESVSSAEEERQSSKASLNAALRRSSGINAGKPLPPALLKPSGSFRTSETLSPKRSPSEGRKRMFSSRPVEGLDSEILLHVEIPALQLESLLSFNVLPGKTLATVTDNLQSALEQLKDHLVEADFAAGQEKLEDCRQKASAKLAAWNERLQEADSMKEQGERARSELARMRISYMKEADNLRNQLASHREADTKGEIFVPDEVILFQPWDFMLKEEDFSPEVKAQLTFMQKEIERLQVRNKQLGHLISTKNWKIDLQTELVHEKIETVDTLCKQVAELEKITEHAAAATDGRVKCEKDQETKQDEQQQQMPRQISGGAESIDELRSQRSEAPEMIATETQTSIDGEAMKALFEAQQQVAEWRSSATPAAKDEASKTVEPAPPSSPKPQGRRPSLVGACRQVSKGRNKPSEHVGVQVDPTMLQEDPSARVQSPETQQPQQSPLEAKQPQQSPLEALLANHAAGLNQPHSLAPVKTSTEKVPELRVPENKRRVSTSRTASPNPQLGKPSPLGLNVEAVNMTGRSSRQETDAGAESSAEAVEHKSGSGKREPSRGKNLLPNVKTPLIDDTECPTPRQRRPSFSKTTLTTASRSST
eukprot:TRINITY_DN3955_c0_g1_i1.p1 TRINITY_DN3955_c0_g1~~TRINITY_DN3955_c0_g1_i1.p1  ORF type:complete len:605 (+),score=135.49 TRINITY_DN3955_c0_g1_i1:57-1871(+)